MSDLSICLIGELVDRQEILVRIEGKMLSVVVREIIGFVAIADDEKLHEAEERFGVTVSRIVLVFDDLFHRTTGTDAKRLEFYLDDWDAIDQQNYVITVMAVIRVDAELVDDLEGVLAPVLDIDQGEIEGRIVITDETTSVP